MTLIVPSIDPPADVQPDDDRPDHADAEESTEIVHAVAQELDVLPEVELQGHADRVEYRHGDFVSLADDLGQADIVLLDRVICCYPDMGALVRLSVGKASRLYGVVYPRDVWWTRLGNRFLNLLFWLSRNPFRVFVHPTWSVDALVRGAGFRQLFHSNTLNWQVVVYGRETT